MTKYIVKDENTLGYLINETPGFMAVLQGSVHQGGHDWRNGPVSILGAQIRPATQEDFNAFRVSLPPDFKD